MKSTLYKVCVLNTATNNKTVVYSSDEERLAVAYVESIKNILSADNEIYIEKEDVSMSVEKIKIHRGE